MGKVNKNNYLYDFDWFLFIVVFGLCVVGVFVIFSATCSAAPGYQKFYIKQMYWLIVGFLGMFLMLFIDTNTLARFAYPLYIVFVLVLGSLIMFPPSAGGEAKRWFHLGGFSIQPAEFMKLVMVITLSRYFSDNSSSGSDIKNMLLPGIIVGVPMILIIKQPDLGTALFFIPIYLLYVFITSARLKYLAGLCGAFLACTPLFWFFLKPYQKQRILTFLNPSTDPLGAGYHIIQSKIAVGSGGLFGKGFLSGTQSRLNFLPAKHTDFVFSVLAEEFGFFGSVLVLLGILTVITRIVDTAFHAKDRFGMFLCVGVAAIVAVDSFVNVGMVLGMLPVTGLPLPFLSYGGSSLVTLLLGIGMVIGVRMRRFS